MPGEKCSVLLEKSSENEEMYLKAVWLVEEEGKNPVHAVEVARMLSVSLPSVVGMFRKLEKKNLLRYDGRSGVSLMPVGREMAEKIVRNLRLTEVWFRDVLKIDYNSTDPCRFEHVMTDAVAKSLSRVLGYPKTCPHGKKIPKA
ncbi:MAG: metal-dependent transcriptional regulator [Candidatus Diapherotrites archaeon]|nr:metal-dependent transcriptional regulator [Candidatus Diapherotrites archaeon]